MTELDNTLESIPALVESAVRQRATPLVTDVVEAVPVAERAQTMPLSPAPSHPAVPVDPSEYSENEVVIVGAESSAQCCDNCKQGCNLCCAGCVRALPRKAERQVITIVSWVLSLLAFIMNSVDAHHKSYTVAGVTGRPHGGWQKDDSVLTAGFGFNSVILILAFCVMKGAPSCSAAICNLMPDIVPRSGHGEWRNTFALHALVAGILHLAFGIEASEKQTAINRVSDGTNEIPGLTIAAIVFAMINAGLLMYLSLCFMTDKLRAAKNGRKDMLCVICLVITVILFSCWLHSSIVRNYWVNAVVIAASCLAALACVDGIAFADKLEETGGSLSFAFNSMLACVLFFVFFVGAAVEIEDHLKEAKILLAIILAAANSVILFLMGQSTSKANFLERTPQDKILAGITIFTIVQFSIASFEFEINDPTPTQSVLCLAAACVFVADVFHVVFIDPMARGFHLLIATVGYFIYFISECVMISKYYFDTSSGVFTPDESKKYRIAVTALVFAAINCVLLGLATYFMFPRREVPEESEASDGEYNDEFNEDNSINVTVNTR